MTLVVKLDRSREAAACLRAMIPAGQVAAAGGRKGMPLASHRQGALIQRYILPAYEGLYQHSSDPRYRSFPLRGKHGIEKKLKAEDHVAHRLMDLAFDRDAFLAGRGSEEHGTTGTTAGYLLHERLVAALDAVYAEPGEYPVLTCGEDAPLWDAVEDTRWIGPQGFALEIPKLLALSPEGLRDTLNKVTDPADILFLRKALSWAISAGGIPNLYRPTKTGRLVQASYAVGVGASPSAGHIIGLTPRQRALLLEHRELPLEDFDIRGSFHALFISLAESLGASVEAVKHYLTHKDDHNRRISGLAESTDTSAAKRVVLSILNGGELVPQSRAIIGLRTPGKVSPKSVAAALNADPFLRQFKSEVKSVGRHLLQRLDSDVNAVGVTYERVTKGGEEFSRRMSHVLQGVEQLCIQRLAHTLTQAGSTLEAVIADGLIVSQSGLSTQGLEEDIAGHAEASLGIPLRVQLKRQRFTSDSTGTSAIHHETQEVDSRDPWDF